MHYRVALVVSSIFAAFVLLLHARSVFNGVVERTSCKTVEQKEDDDEASNKNGLLDHTLDRYEVSPPLQTDEQHHIGNNTQHRQSNQMLAEPAAPLTDTRPHFILHLGPRKTGTTTIQCTLLHFQNFLRTNTSYTFIGRSIKHACAKGRHKRQPTAFLRNIVKHSWLSCLETHHTLNEIESCEAWVDFKKEVNALAQQGRSVIFSDEDICLIQWSEMNMGLFHSTLSKDFNVQVVFVYRHYFDLLVSEWNQRTKMKQRFARVWTDNRTEGYPPLVEFIREKRFEFPQYLAPAVAANRHPVSYLKAIWERFFDDIVILDMYIGKDLFAQFLQRTSRELYQSRLHELKFDAKETNPSKNVYVDKLALAAHDAGMIQYGNRTEARETLRSTFNDSFWEADNLPRICLSDVELDTLFNQSVMFEATVFPQHFGNPYYRETHKKLFDAAVAQHRFCDPDFEALLSEDEAVRAFLWNHNRSSG